MAKYLAKIKKIKQNWATSENFGICFDISFECCDKNWSLDGRLDIAPLQLHKFPTQIRDFFFVSIFISIFHLSFSLFSNSWWISNSKLTLLDIKFRFSYSGSNSHWNTENCHNILSPIVGMIRNGHKNQ